MNHIHPLEPIGVVVLIVILYYMRKKQGVAAGRGKGAPGGPAATKPAKVEQPPEVVYMNLRRQALEMPLDSLGPYGDLKEGDPYGIVMEMGIPNSVVTLACFADGDARVYYKAGGGMVGGIGHESVRKAAKEFVALAGKNLPGMSRTTTYPLPETDRVRFYVLTQRGIFTAETDRHDMAEIRNDLSTMFYKGQEVVTEMRQVQEEKGRG
jgi:hypothetical protein